MPDLILTKAKHRILIQELRLGSDQACHATLRLDIKKARVLPFREKQARAIRR
jgi:hypothetical protein